MKTKIILVCIFISAYCQSASKIDLVSDESQFFAGASSDGRFISSVGSSKNFARKDIDLDVWSLFNIDNDASSSNLSPNGQYQMWVQNASDNIRDDLLRYYDYSTSQFYDVYQSLAEGENTYGAISKPQFISNTNKMAVMLGTEDIFSRRFNTILIKDFLTGEESIIEPVNIEPPFGFYNIVKFKISSDGSSLVYSIKNTYVAGDCCFSIPGYLVHYDLATQTSKLILEQVDNIDLYSKFDYSADGSTIVYQNGDDIILYDVNNETYKNIDISSSLKSGIDWLELSEDGSVLAIMGNGRFSDNAVNGYSSEFIIDDELNAGENISYITRKKVLLVMDLTSQKIVIVNKFNNYQLFEPVPLSLSADGGKVYMMTQQGDRKLYLSHVINYEFKADAAVTGTWYDPSNPGQGITINFAPSDEDPLGQAIVTLYTVDNLGNPFWLIMQSFIQGNSLTGDAFKVTGSAFGENFNGDEAMKSLWGTITIEFSDCKNLSLNYVPLDSDFESGNLQLSRLSFQAGIGCL